MSGTFFDLGPDGQVEIGDYCTIVGAIFSTNTRVSIGDHCFVSHEVVISDTPWGTAQRRQLAECDPRCDR